MGRAARMHVNRCSVRETPGGAGMIEMNMTQKNVANVLRFETGFAKIDNHVVERRFWPSIEQRDPVLGFERGRGDDPGEAELARIQNVNLHRNYFFETATM